MIKVHLSPYFVRSKTNSEIFQRKEFRDTSGIHRYYTIKDETKKPEGKYDAINAIIECYADLRTIAEEREKSCGNIHVANPAKAVPLPLSEVSKYLLSKESSQEPPLSFITKLAIEYYSIINILIHGMHKVLRRNRSLIPVDKVQQIDVQCIRWLSRQPGRTTYERAGNRQKILSVVRYESVNTLENRVFKQFLEYCRINCDSYIYEYQNEYPDSTRLLAVIRLRNLIDYAFSLPEFASIAVLHSIPQPNYVLQNNPLYRIVWNLYLQILHRTRLVETLWQNRHNVVREFSKMVFLTFCHRKANITRSPIVHNLWILQFADDNGSFFEDSYWHYMDYDAQKDTSYALLEGDILFRYVSQTSSQHIIQEYPKFPFLN